MIIGCALSAPKKAYFKCLGNSLRISPSELFSTSCPFSSLLLDFSVLISFKLGTDSIWVLFRHPFTSFVLLEPAAPLVSPNFLEMHVYWPETQLCLPGMSLAHKTFVHECSSVFCSLT